MATPAWNADLRSAQRAEGPRTTRRESSWATEVRERPLRPVAPGESHPAGRRRAVRCAVAQRVPTGGRFSRWGPAFQAGGVTGARGLTWLRPWGPRADRRWVFQAGGVTGTRGLTWLRPWGPRADRRSAFQAGGVTGMGGLTWLRPCGPRADRRSAFQAGGVTGTRVALRGCGPVGRVPTGGGCSKPVVSLGWVALRGCGPGGRVPTGGRRSKPGVSLGWVALRGCGPVGRVPTGGRRSKPAAPSRAPGRPTGLHFDSNWPPYGGHPASLSSPFGGSPISR